MNNDFSTNDLNLATALVASGFELSELDRTNPRRVQFIFRYDSKLDQVIESYWQNTLTVPAQELLNTQRQLKSRLYADTQGARP